MPPRFAHTLPGHVIAAVLVLSACSGEVSGGDARAGIEDGRTGVSGTPGLDSSPTTPAPAGDACGEPVLREPRAVLGSMEHYVNSLRDLLGAQAVSAESAAAVGRVEFDVVDRAHMTPATLDRVLGLAEAAVESVRGRSAGLLGCSGHDDSACLRRGLTGFARSAFGRAPQDDEIDALMTLRDSIAAEGGQDAGESGTLVALQAILAAPSTLYRTEFRGPQSGSTVELSAHERAAALAALLLESIPDAELLAAADDGSLMTREGVSRQLQRLLATPRVREHLTALMLSAFKIPKLFETPKDTTRFPEYTPELRASMYEESRRFMDDVLWTRSAPLSELLTSRRTFVDRKLAAVYGVDAPSGDGFTAVELPAQRAGLLTQASVLTVLARTDKTSVVARGLFIRGPLLCLPKIPGPPAAVQAQVAAQLMQDASEAALAGYRAMTSPCNGCHSQFDPFGLLLEPFDAIGRSRPTQAGEAEGTLPAPLQGKATTVAQLVQQVASDHRFTQCLAQRTLAHALSEPYEPGADACALGRAPLAFSQRDGSLQALLDALVNDPGFFRRKVAP